MAAMNEVFRKMGRVLLALDASDPFNEEIVGLNTRATSNGNSLLVAVDNEIPFNNPTSDIITPTDISLSTSRSVVANSDSDRRSVIVQNLDDTENVRVGDTNIGSSRGIRLGPGESITLETTDTVYAIAESGTPSVAVLEIDFD